MAKLEPVSFPNRGMVVTRDPGGVKEDPRPRKELIEKSAQDIIQTITHEAVAVGGLLRVTPGAKSPAPWG
jgi:hypothetical protein